MSGQQHRIAIAHAAFLGGGAEAVTLWALQALQKQCRTSLITLLPIDLQACNDRYGTKVCGKDVEVLPVLKPSDFTERLYRHASMLTLRQQILSRAVRKRRKCFDLVISTFNEMDFGSPGVQYIHAPMFSSYSSEARKLLQFPDSFNRRCVKRAIGILFGASERNIRRNLSLTNSNWTASLLRRACNVEAKVLYPPVLIEGSTEASNLHRTGGFLCVGRFARDKRIELAIEIIERVRAKGADVDLRIVGSSNDSDYRTQLEKIQQTRSSWLALECNIPRSRLTELIRKYKFGIQPREAEQFGIAVAEMAAGGCIPFVPVVGGQAEIVGNDSRLTFNGTDDAVAKISNVIANPGVEEDVRSKLLLIQRQFSAGNFMFSFKGIVGDVLRGDLKEAKDVQL